MSHADIRSDIARIVYWKQVAADHDKTHALPWKLPRVAATLEQLDAAELEVGQTLPREYREFLGLANGWQGFHVLTDLYGTEELTKGNVRQIVERPELHAYLAENGWRREEVLPIGASSLDVDVFLLVREDAQRLPGGVVWFAQEEVERFASFHEFLAAMVSYNEQVANRMMALASKG